MRTRAGRRREAAGVAIVLAFGLPLALETWRALRVHWEWPGGWLAGLVVACLIVFGLLYLAMYFGLMRFQTLRQEREERRELREGEPAFRIRAWVDFVEQIRAGDYSGPLDEYYRGLENRDQIDRAIQERGSRRADLKRLAEADAEFFASTRAAPGSPPGVPAWWRWRLPKHASGKLAEELGGRSAAQPPEG